jgi:hypothetical protein
MHHVIRMVTCHGGCLVRVVTCHDGLLVAVATVALVPAYANHTWVEMGLLVCLTALEQLEYKPALC